MWVFCGGMRRAGSTLQFQLTAHLVEKAGLGTRVDAARAAEFPRVRDEQAERPGWKVFKSHRCTAEMAAEFDAGNARGVYVYRDVRDVIVSWSDWSGESLDRTWRGTLESVLANYERWSRLDGMLVSRYEDMIADVPAEVRRIAAHLDIPVSHEESEEIAAAYSVARQLERIDDEGERGLGGPPRAVTDRGSNLRIKHIRSGRSGRWSGVLTARQLARIESRAGDWLTSHGYELAVPRWQRSGFRVLHALTDRLPSGRRREKATRSVDPD